MGKGYYVGLDMGTGSVGWAVTDESYQILRRHGKAMWGVRLFESAKTAEERRMFRTGRRRLDRRGWRIEILQEIFAEEISRVDPGFFLRMKESKYYPEDKRDIQGNCPELPYTLFVDKTFTDKDFHKKYPTIYHLRKMLMETEDTPDIRLVYLALHHMMKHRGHFLLSGDISQVTEFKNTFNQFIENIRNEGMDFEIELDESAVQMIEETLKDKNLTRSAKKAKLVKGLNAKNVRDKAFLTLLSGGTVKLSDLFGMEELNEGERPKISFADNRYEEYAAVVEMELGELYYIVESAKAVYDWAILSDILGGSTSVSDAKVRAYEKHKADLKYLKAVVKEYFPKEVYNAVFVESSDKLNNYPAYIGMTKKNGKKVSLEGKRCSREEFMDFLKKNIVVKLPDEETKMYLQSELEKDSFLPKQVNKDNGVIPYQVHKYELKKILDNLGDKIPFLKENAEKIEKLFSFRIPYYVGPLRTGNGENSKFAWAERKSTEKIYPWNFENVIDVEQSAENFIRRMTNKCTYLIGEDVLPKDSLLYSKFMVLNELNNLRLDGQKISVELKQKIYRDVFCRSRKVTQKKLKSYLIREGIAGKNVELTGIDGDFKGSLTAYHDFKEKLTGVELTQKEKERVFVEMAREKQENKRMESRKKTLSDLYKKCKKEEPEWIETLCTSLEKHEEHQLRSDKLYLYYTQKGRCMYSGEPIDLEDLWDNTKYDIDHIYPQSKTMDDSLKNRVLVKKEYNAKKSDTYPIAADIQKKMMPFWKSLLTGGFIPKEKYDRLVRNNPLDANELAGFIERQIVETRQSTKAVAEILKKILPDTEIVYVKAKTVSKFRQDFDFIKVRDMNDLHHAKDAYLNIVVGNVYFVKFTKNAGWFVKENPGRTYNLEKMFIWDVARDGEIAWKAGKSGSIVQVRAMMEKNHILVTRRSYEVKGGLFDQQILKKGKGQVPVKESDERLRDIGKYGGYNKAAGAYFMLVSSKDKKGKEQRTIEFVPIYLKDRVEKDMESARNYLMEERGLREPKILIKKIKIDTLFKVDGFYMWLSGRTSNQLIFKGANQLILSKEDMKTLKKVVKYIQRQKEDKNVKISVRDGITEEELLKLYETFLDKIRHSIYGVRLSSQEKTLVNGKEKFIDLSVEAKCQVLYEILHLFQCQSGASNLKMIGGPASAGILVMNNNISKCKNISIVNQSPTGIYEKEIDLLRV